MAAANPTDVSGEDACGTFGPGRVGWLGWWLVPLILVASFLIIALVGVGLGWHPGGPPGSAPVPFFWPLFPLGFLVLVLVGFFLFRWALWGGRGWPGHGRWGPLSAREVLRWRYARGELTTEQFRQMSRELDAPTLR